MASWKQIEGFENYMVSADGQIMRKACTIWTKTGSRRLPVKMISTQATNGRYPYVVLYRNGERNNFYVHRLVAKAFVPNPDNLPCVNHKNYNTLDNRASNLEWCTYRENALYSSPNMRKPHQVRLGKTGEKYISIIGSGYRVVIRRAGFDSVDRRFKALEEAIAYRDGILEERNEKHTSE